MLSQRHSSRRRHLDCTGTGTSKTIRPVHVLHIGLWMHVAAGRHRPHHIGDREYGAVAVLAIERGGETVVAELGARGLDSVLDPAERAGLARGHQPRVV